MSATQLTVVVPVLNERDQVPALAHQLRVLEVDPRCQVIVVDGGSDDGSAQALSESGLTVISSERGRALQMNTGAEQAAGEIVLFLHADTCLPDNALDRVIKALAPGRHWGRFDVRIAGRSLWFPLIGLMINLRSRFTGIATGDQAIFVRRDVFERIQGFPAQPLMEDIELSKRLLCQQRPVCLRDKVSTSGRRWECRGVWRTILLMWRLRFDYWRGVPAAAIAARYR